MANVTSLDFANATLCLGKAGLTAGTTTTLTIANTITFAVQGKLYSKTNASNIATPTTDCVQTVTGTTTALPFVAIQPNNGSVFAICLDTSGNLKVTQGTVAPLDVAGNFVNSPQFPDIPTEAASYQGGAVGPFCPIGYLVVKAGSTASAWTFGSSNLAGPPTGLTFAWQDIIALPGRPQVA